MGELDFKEMTFRELGSSRKAPPELQVVPGLEQAARHAMGRHCCSALPTIILEVMSVPHNPVAPTKSWTLVSQQLGK